MIKFDVRTSSDKLSPSTYLMSVVVRYTY